MYAILWLCSDEQLLTAGRRTSRSSRHNHRVAAGALTCSQFTDSVYTDSVHKSSSRARWSLSMVLLIHRLRVVKLQVWISAQPILAQPNLTLDRSTARALGRSQSTDSTLERFQTTVKLTRLLQGTDLAEPRYYSLVFGFKNQATDLVSHEWLIGRVSYCVCISSNQINSRHRFSYSFADSLPHSLILSLSLPCNLTLTQSRTHTHSLSLVLVVMMKSKVLKIKISLTHSLILFLAFSLALSLSLSLFTLTQSHTHTITHSLSLVLVVMI